MNVLVVNQQESVVSNLNVEIIKTLRGTFTADEVIITFSNFFFARMIIDITALQDFESVLTYQKISIGLPIDKIILLIPPNSSVADKYFLSKLISMGFYNFTTNADGIMYLLNTPNTYKEVAHLHQIDQQPIQQVIAVPPTKGNKEQSYLTGIRTLGIKNVTEGAGASSLIYMMKKELEDKYDFRVMAFEVDKRDFIYFREKNMSTTDKGSLATDVLKARDFHYVLVDLNDYEDNVCDETLYLIEPSVIKLNKLMMRDRQAFSRINDKKVIINKSVLSDKDIKEFASEAGINIYHVLPPINDRENSQAITDLLIKLGMVRN